MPCSNTASNSQAKPCCGSTSTGQDRYCQSDPVTKEECGPTSTSQGKHFQCNPAIKEEFPVTIRKSNPLKADPDDEAVANRKRELLRLYGYRTHMTGRVLAQLAERVHARDESMLHSGALVFEPFYFFFYGSLQSPMILADVCQLVGGSQVLTAATIKGWKIKKWGPYPALVPAEGEVVKGVCWKCESPKHVALLRRYESDAYSMEFCEITTHEGRVIENGRVFVTALPDQELEEGTFDLETFMQARMSYY